MTKQSVPTYFTHFFFLFHVQDHVLSSKWVLDNRVQMFQALFMNCKQRLNTLQITALRSELFFPLNKATARRERNINEAQGCFQESHGPSKHRL